MKKSLTVMFAVLCVFPTLGMAKNRNVVLLVSDNQNKIDCGCYGNEVIQTPNLDWLAKEGVRYRDAFATTASCGPSRAVIYSGLQTHRNGQYGHGHGTHTYGLSSRVTTVFKSLVDAGYQTALLGKQHTTPASAYPFTYESRISGRDVVTLGKRSKEFIQQAGEQPFFLTIGFSDPHPTGRDYPGWGIVKDFEGVPKVSYDPAKIEVPNYLPDRPEVRENLARYYQQITRMDDGIGRVLKVLDELGKADDTLVIFTSDHGSSEPGAMANHYEAGIQVPFIVRHPEGVGAGTVHPALVTLADITPTILDWTGVKGPKTQLDGRSILPTLGQPNIEGWDEVMLSHVAHEVTMVYPMRTIRNRRYKLIWNMHWRNEYPLPIDTLHRWTWRDTIRRGEENIGPRSVEKFLFRDEVELYDLQSDPLELNNLAASEDLADVRKSMSGRLLEWLQRTDDEWLVRHRLPLGPNEHRSSRQRYFDTPEHQSP